MLSNVYINKIHGRQCLCISLYCTEGFSHPFNFIVVSRGILCLISKQRGRKKISMEQLKIDSYKVLCMQNNFN